MTPGPGPPAPTASVGSGFEPAASWRRKWGWYVLWGVLSAIGVGILVWVDYLSDRALGPGTTVSVVVAETQATLAVVALIALFLSQRTANALEGIVKTLLARTETTEEVPEAPRGSDTPPSGATGTDKPPDPPGRGRG